MCKTHFVSVYNFVQKELICRFFYVIAIHRLASIEGICLETDVQCGTCGVDAVDHNKVPFESQFLCHITWASSQLSFLSCSYDSFSGWCLYSLYYNLCLQMLEVLTSCLMKMLYSSKHINVWMIIGIMYFVFPCSSTSLNITGTEGLGHVTVLSCALFVSCISNTVLVTFQWGISCKKFVACHIYFTLHGNDCQIRCWREALSRYLCFSHYCGLECWYQKVSCVVTLLILSHHLSGIYQIYKKYIKPMKLWFIVPHMS